MIKRFKDLWQNPFSREEWDWYSYCCYMDRSKPSRIKFFWGCTCHLARVATCIVFGHGKLHDDSYGGPDSGYVHVTCTRCRCDWHTDLY